MGTKADDQSAGAVTAVSCVHGNHIALHCAACSAKAEPAAWHWLYSEAALLSWPAAGISGLLAWQCIDKRYGINRNDVQYTFAGIYTTTLQLYFYAAIRSAIGIGKRHALSNNTQ